MAAARVLGIRGLVPWEFDSPLAYQTFMCAWRNRQTRKTEGLVRETGWEFNSPRAHQF